jgi:hypothetical protein
MSTRFTIPQETTERDVARALIDYTKRSKGDILIIASMALEEIEYYREALILNRLSQMPAIPVEE